MNPKKEEPLVKRKLAGSKITSVVSVSMVLFAIGLIGLIVLHTKKLSDYVKENVGFTVFMNKNVKEADIVKLQKQIDSHEFVRSTLYISEEKAAEDYQKELGVNFVQFIGKNPLHTSIEVYFKAEYSKPLLFEQLIDEIQKNPHVKEVTYQQTLISDVNKNATKTTLLLLGFSLIFLIIAITLINNTIRLSVYAKRFLIKSMQLVGATESFIRKPFLLNGIITGFISAIISIAMLIGIILYFRKLIPEIISLQSIDLFLILFAFIIVSGILLTLISTYLAVRKYLKTKSDYLFY